MTAYDTADHETPRVGRRPTSADVARLAGVSRATVSYVLNGRSERPIGEQARLRVLAAVRELGYTPHSTARTLRSGRSDLVLAPMPRLPMGPTRHRYFEALSQELSRRGLNLLIHGDRRAEGVDGARAWAQLRPAAVVADADRCPPEAAAFLRRAGVDAVLLTGPRALPYAPTLVVAGAAVAELATRHLIDSGRRRLACLVPGGDIAAVGRARFEAVTAAAGAAGVPVQRVDCELDDGALAAAAAAWRDPALRPDAVYAYNDEFALVLIQELRDAGLDVPGDIAVVGSGNLPLGAALRPALTTTYYDPTDTAAAVATAIEHLLQGPGGPSVTGPRPRLLVRASG
ncbi:LacI family DNA-binding transcriptional regulator [Kitasatospora sp. NPDC092286]|uniref:LacI family DNA-binding transcriptional regulator n=1 Tax=Kitasatospora sp. NPDC092286 TaxID=3364087 RepID=UPI0038296A5A